MKARIKCDVPGCLCEVDEEHDVQLLALCWFHIGTAAPLLLAACVLAAALYRDENSRDRATEEMKKFYREILAYCGKAPLN